MSEFSKFDEMMKTLIKVPHGDIKAKLEAEKAAKKAKKEGRKVKNGETRHTS